MGLGAERVVGLTWRKRYLKRPKEVVEGVQSSSTKQHRFLSTNDLTKLPLKTDL